MRQHYGEGYEMQSDQRLRQAFAVACQPAEARQRIQFLETLIDDLLALAAGNLGRVRQTSKRRRE